MMYEIKNSAQADTLDIHIYSDICKSWWDEDDCMDADKFRKLLDENKDAKNINLYINSMGGSVAEGVAIYSQIKRHAAYVTAYIDGFACSIASVIPMAADKIVMSDCAMMMIHNPWTFTYGNASELRKTADDLDKILNGSIIPAYRNKAGDKIAEEELRNLIDNETYLTSEECLNYGLCDEIMKSENDKEAAKNKFTDAVNAAKSEMMNKFAQMYARSMEPPKDEETEKADDTAEPEKEEEKAAPEAEKESEPEIQAEDKTKIHETFMKCLKGEI